MVMKNYLLIYNKKKILYWGSHNNLPKVTIDNNTIIETFNAFDEMIERKEEVDAMIIANTENPSKYYNELWNIADRIESIACFLYTNAIHYENVNGDINEFDDGLRQVISIIKMDLIDCFLDEEARREGDNNAKSN